MISRTQQAVELYDAIDVMSIREAARLSGVRFSVLYRALTRREGKRCPLCQQHVCPSKFHFIEQTAYPALVKKIAKDEKILTDRRLSNQINAVKAREALARKQGRRPTAPPVPWETELPSAPPAKAPSRPA